MDSLRSGSRSAETCLRMVRTTRGNSGSRTGAAWRHRASKARLGAVALLHRNESSTGLRTVPSAQKCHDHHHDLETFTDVILII